MKDLSTISKNYSSALSGVAKDVFNSLSLPTKKNEDYKYTNFNDRLPEQLEVAKKADFNAGRVKSLEGLFALNAPILLINNGHLDNTLSKDIENIKGLNISEYEFGLPKKYIDSFEAMNFGVNPKGIHLELQEKEKLPLLIIAHVANSSASGQWKLPKLKLSANKFSEITLLEVFIQEETFKSFESSYTEINAAEESKVEHIKLILDGPGSLHIGKLRATVERNSRLNSLSFSFGSNLSRNNLHIDLNAPGAEAGVHGLFTLRGEQHCDNFSAIHHNKEHTRSTQIFKGIIDDQAHGVFTGKVVVHKDAQLVDSSQLNKNLLLAPKAHIDTRPQLEVYADDVKCAHGATIGQISKEETFYLESRGIPHEKAQKILCHAFANEVIQLVGNKDVKIFLANALYESFEKYALEDLSKNDGEKS